MIKNSWDNTQDCLDNERINSLVFSNFDKLGFRSLDGEFNAWKEDKCYRDFTSCF
jgi:hypothetical protein